MTLSSANLSRKVVDIEFDNIQGTQVIGAYGFAFQLKVRVKPKPRNVDLIYEIHRANISIGAIQIGVAFPETSKIIEFYEYDQDSNLTFLLQLDKSRLEALEELRNGEELKLDLWIHGVCRCDNEIKIAHGKIDVVIDQKQWLNALNQTGYRNFFLFEVPFPGSGKEYDDVISYMKKAHELYLQGHYEVTLTNCRSALENLKKKLDLQKKLSKARKDFCSDRETKEAMSLDERFYLLYEITNNIANIGPHPGGEPEGERVRRRDAKLVLSMSGSLISHALAIF